MRREHPAILNNELTLAFWIMPAGHGTLVRHGYAHYGFFAGMAGNGGVDAGGGGEWHVASTNDNLVDSKWHNVAITIGGEPFREIRLYVDGVMKGSGKSKAPCLTQSLEFFDGYNGILSEIRLYNRVLDADEISALATPDKAETAQ
jgi:hypothetical protein